MKLAFLIPGTFAIALAYAMTAFAETPDIRSNMRDLTGCENRVSVPSFSQIDVDRDGRINYRELKATDKRDAPLFQVMDEDRNGFISQWELTEHTADRGGCVN